MQQLTGIPQDELAQRRERLLDYIRSQKLSGYVLFDEKYIQYMAEPNFRMSSSVASYRYVRIFGANTEKMR